MNALVEAGAAQYKGMETTCAVPERVLQQGGLLTAAETAVEIETAAI
jgi:hypothetical protein